MNGRRIAVAIFIIACLAALLFSYSSWKQKIAGMSLDEMALAGPLSEIASTNEGQEQSVSEVDSAIGEDIGLTMTELVTLTANMDERLGSLLNVRFEESENVKLLIVGSQAIEQGGNGGAAWLLASSLNDAYKGFIETDIISFQGTSREFIDEMVELVDLGKYDVVLLEPFTLNNNGRVIIEDEHRHILQIRDALQEGKEDSLLLVMPSQPIHRPNFYMTQIRSLQNFTEKRGIPFINHWTAWPDVADEEVLEYLDDNSAPNDAGAVAWGTALRDYFIGAH